MLVENVPLSSSLKYNEFKDFYFRLSETDNSEGFYFESWLTQVSFPNNQLRLTILDENSPFTTTSLNGIVYRYLNKPLGLYMRIRVSWDNNIGVIPKPYDVLEDAKNQTEKYGNETITFDITYTTTYSYYPFFMLNFGPGLLVLVCLMITSAILLAIRRYYLQRQMMRQRTAPNTLLAGTLPPILYRYKGTRESIGGLIPISIERFDYSGYPMTATNYIIVMPAGETFGIGINLSCQLAVAASSSSDQGPSEITISKKKKGENIPLQFIKRSNVYE